MQYVKNSLHHKNLLTISIKFKSLSLGIKQSAQKKNILHSYTARYITHKKCLKNIKILILYRNTYIMHRKLQ